MRGFNNFTNKTQVARKLSFKRLRIESIVPGGGGFGTRGSKPNLTVTVVFFFYLFYRTKTPTDKLNTPGLKELLLKFKMVYFSLSFSSSLKVPIQFRLNNGKFGFG